VDVAWWPSTSVRRAAAIFPESEVDRTRRGHRGARDPELTFGCPLSCNIEKMCRETDLQKREVDRVELPATVGAERAERVRGRKPVINSFVPKLSGFRCEFVTPDPPLSKALFEPGEVSLPLCLVTHVAALKTCCCPTIGGEWSQSGQFVPSGFEWALSDCHIKIGKYDGT
jgi:hypothetical protein